MKSGDYCKENYIDLTNIDSIEEIALNYHFEHNELAGQNSCRDRMRIDSSTHKNNDLPRRNFAGRKSGGQGGFS